MDTQPIPIDQTASSTTKAEQNRINAQHSTGPRTEEGKKRSSLNALKHGLCSHVVVMPNENMEAFKRFCEIVRNALGPIGDYELELSQKAADTRWRMNRVGAIEANLFSLGHEALAENLKVNDEDPASNAIQAAMAAARTFRYDPNTFIKLGQHEVRLLKVYKATMEELKQVQAERFARMKEEAAQIEKIRKLHKEKGRAFDPAKFGFVSKPSVIETYFLRQDAFRDGILPEIDLEE